MSEALESFVAAAGTVAVGAWACLARGLPRRAVTVKAAATKAVAKKKTYMTLPASATQWGAYRQGAQTVTRNIFAYLVPKQYGGLTYEVKGWTVQNQVALIDIQTFGRVQV